MNLNDNDSDYLQAKNDIEKMFEKHKQEYKELTGNDYTSILK
jgi:hypothetical protein